MSGEAIFWGGLLRFLQAFLQATPTILVGLFVAGICRRLLGHTGTRRLFGSGTWRELPQAWLIGMLLPVCSLGVIPVAREMKRAGIAGGTILAFAMTAPLFNPVSILYGLTLSEPFVILAFAFCSLLVVTLVGAAWDRLFPGTRAPEPDEPPPVAHGIKRMTAIAVVAAREVVGPSLGYLLIGLAGVAALSAVLPPGSLQSTMEHGNRFAPLQMVGVAIPAYATPLVAMSQLGSMFQHANSVGAAFVLLTLGAGLNLGLLAWMLRSYGLKRGLACLGLVVAVVVGLAYAIEEPLHPSEITPPGHTHAFDIYCSPFDASVGNLPAVVVAKLREKLQPFEVVGVVVLGVLAVLGMALRGLDRRWRVEEWLERPEDSERRAAWFDVVVPGPVLGLVGLAGLFVMSIVGCYAYYPSKYEVFDEMQILRGEVLSAALSGDRKHADHFIPVWADWTRRLQVGVFLREGSVSPYQRMKGKVFRDRLEVLKHAVEDNDREEVREYFTRVSEAYRRMRMAYLEPGG
jgi:uncharacterized membrane protein YraQ (UPF0718 family)